MVLVPDPLFVGRVPAERPSGSLAYLNQAVYPFYIVHMPLTFLGLRVSTTSGLEAIPVLLTALVVSLC